MEKMSVVNLLVVVDVVVSRQTQKKKKVEIGKNKIRSTVPSNPWKYERSAYFAYRKNQLNRWILLNRKR